MAIAVPKVVLRRAALHATATAVSVGVVVRVAPRSLPMGVLMFAGVWAGCMGATISGLLMWETLLVRCEDWVRRIVREEFDFLEMRRLKEAIDRTFRKDD